MKTTSKPLLRSTVLDTPSNLLNDYLDRVNQTLLSLTENIDQDISAAAEQLKQTLTRIQVRQLKRTAITQGAWDFYPTPQPIIDKILSKADLQPHHRVLEPSAGSGDLCEAIAQFGVAKIDCFEIQPLLQAALKLQGFNLLGDDFLHSQPRPIYNRIIANPPFGNNGVARHTTHAFQFLKPGGRLITLAHHYRLQPSRTDRAFFTWLQQNNARFLNCRRAFKYSDRVTNIPLQIIVVDKTQL